MSHHADTGEFRVVPAGPLTLEALAELHAQCFDEAWDRASFARLLAMPGAFALLAQRGPEAAAKPVGFVLYRIAADEAEIISIGVIPKERRLGAGSALMRAVFGWAQALGVLQIVLEVATDSSGADALYRSLGFVEIGRRPGYYRRRNGTADARVLARPLTQPPHPPDAMK